MDIALICVVGAMNILCFVIGAKIGQKVAKGETIEMPNPIKAVSEYKESQEQKAAQEEREIMLYNIDNYNGTGLGQRDV